MSCTVFKMSQASVDMSRLVDTRLTLYLLVVGVFVYGNRKKNTIALLSSSSPSFKVLLLFPF